MEYPKICVLILSFNGKHMLTESISSYLQNDYPNFEVAIMDNGSTDGTFDFIKSNFPSVKIYRNEENLGYSGGFNFGLDLIFNQDYDYALISNNDVKAHNRVISELVKVSQLNKKIGFVTGKVYYYDKPNILQTVGKKEDPLRWNGGHIGNKEEDIGQYDNICERYFADDIFMLINKTVYKETGGYNTTFFLQSEEYDWQARAKKLGFIIMYTPYAKIWHKESMTIGRDSALKAYYDARNPMLVILIHKSPEFFRKYFWLHLREDIFLGSLAYLKRLKPTNAIAQWAGFVSGIMWGLKNKKFSIRHFL